jgi:hypothetical protein
MKWLCATLGMLLLLTQTAHAQQTATEPQVRRLSDAANSEFRDTHNRAWIVIDLDPVGNPDFGSFALFVFPSPFELAVGYFGMARPQPQPDGTFSLDERVSVMVKRPTQEIVPTGQDVPVSTESGEVHLQGAFDPQRHATSLRVQVDGREVLIEAQEPSLDSAPITATAALNAYVGEDWPALYDLYTSGMHAEVSRDDFIEQMRTMTPPGPPVQVLSSELTDATLRTVTGFVHYSQASRVDLLQPSGRVTPSRLLVILVWESGSWRLFHINLQRINAPPGEPGQPAA